MAGRTRRASQAFQPVKVLDEEFISGEKFDFTIASPKGVVTRSRRSSIGIGISQKPCLSKRRMTMLPAVKETSTRIAPTSKKNKILNKSLSNLEILASLESETENIKRSSPKKAKAENKVSSKSKEIVKPSMNKVNSMPSKKSKECVPKINNTKANGSNRLKTSDKKKVERTTLPKPNLKTPKKSEKQSLKDLPPGSPLLSSIMKDIKKVQVKLTPLKIKEDPNKIFELLEGYQEDKFRVKKVVDEIVKIRKDASPITRLNTSNKETKEKPKSKGSVKKPVDQIEQKPKNIIKSESLLNIERTTSLDSKRQVKELKAKAPQAITKSAKKESSRKQEFSLTKKGIKRTLDTQDNSVPSKKMKLEVKSRSPSLKKNFEAKANNIKIKAEPVTPIASTGNKIAKKETSKTPSSIRQSSTKKTRTPVGSLKKPLKRLAPTQGTPAQIKPGDLLKKNMKKQVEKAISAKIASKPNSSPYVLNNIGDEENSPKLTKVMTNVAIKSHITGTPARVKPNRKFGTVIQPLSLLEESVIPVHGIDHNVVSSSTPLKPEILDQNDFLPRPHPLEAVEATPIRPPNNAEAKSPQPMLVTGGLAKMCSIM